MTKPAYILIVLTVLLLAHLLEEIKTGFRRKLIFGAMPRAVFALANAVIYAYALTTIILAFKGSATACILAWIYGIGIALNACLHIGIMIIKRGYFPGGISAFALLPAAVYLLIELAGLPG